MKAAALFSVLLLSSAGLAFSQNSAEAFGETQPHVTAVFPSSDTLPANLLRMYVHFSSPMKLMGNLEKIQLMDEADQEVVGAIFDNAYELWNHEQTQLTLLFDPSRVKTGLSSHKARGRALVKGKKYSLQIGVLEDVDGRRTRTFTKSFLVAEEDLTPPNTNFWEVNMPKAGSRAALVIHFPERLDRLSLLQRLKLTDTENKPIAGRVKIAKNETEWRFYPIQNWQKADYLCYIHTRLEDPSGNNLNGLFDHKPGGLKNKREGLIECITLKIEE